VKWVAHLDADALRSSVALSEFVKDVLSRHKIGKLADSAQSRPWTAIAHDKLQSITLYGGRIGIRDGAAVVTGKWDQEKLAGEMKAHPDVKAVTHGSHTFYTWTKYKDTDRAHDVALAFPKTGVMVFASSAKQLGTAVDVLEGKGDSLQGKKSPLTAEVAEGTVLLARAAGLKADDVGPNFEFFRLIRGFDYRFVEHDGKVREALSVTAGSEKIADKLRAVLAGRVAMMELTFHGQKGVLDLFKPEIKSDGATVSIHFQADAKQLAKQMPKITATLHEEFESRMGLARMMLGERAPAHGHEKPDTSKRRD